MKASISFTRSRTSFIPMDPPHLLLLRAFASSSSSSSQILTRLSSSSSSSFSVDLDSCSSSSSSSSSSSIIASPMVCRAAQPTIGLVRQEEATRWMRSEMLATLLAINFPFLLLFDLFFSHTVTTQ
ncbi:uncharacterized protein M6B38_138790 [Iris pallida]|uniref:Uncharacterized protein n=1 Tax=Iris pallida TaxID=29817 RepID=A0AAX6FDL6_IRIPA|nr:uncharacterized protein M6B38_138790 [Iris pallida]